ncbi:MAG TPA: hypothetical protein DCS90_10490, partial [Ktedonobacter sp.]|nr:hypothetical protein [Ktedonobacter sp.]
MTIIILPLGAVGILALAILFLMGRHVYQIRRIPLQEQEREQLALEHAQQMEVERLELIRERQAHDLQLAGQRHTLELRMEWERHQLDKHLALTRISADQKGHYPYMVHPEQGYQALPNVNMRQLAAARQDEDTEDTGRAIPSLVRYEDVKASIPQGHALVGISERGLETREDSIRALVWVVGGSGVGKTNSVSLRVDDDYERGHRFLGIDPHAFKSDSLTNALRGYASRFLLPLAQRLEDINQVLDTFLIEFERRKAGGAWQYPITLVVDEVGSMVSDIDKEEPLESDVSRKLKTVARICGQESRGFQMVGIFISQDAAGLSWLRKRALMVLAHQVMMWSERILVCNNNTTIAREMDTWPIGRTLAYGMAFSSGPIVVQQPIFRSRIVEANIPNLADNPFTPGRTIVNAV